ncbi:unnamed protein product [Thlaspi arvense]|uniref:Rad21/Rec8-like protein N-terminal domain-containing protein n=1 Tax=Thlaspi arvense TaxID=13288 RepID=A0AAU9SZY2_THLAR|nr:unnamed protein product [Thlaspi arvense]
MFYSHQLLARKAPLGQIWMAATLHAKINRKKLDKLDIIQICEEILNPSVPMALRLSGILMGGVVIVYERKVKLLYDDVSRLLVEINGAWRTKAVPDPTLLPKGKTHARKEAVTLPENDEADFGDFEQTRNLPKFPNFMDYQQTYISMRLDESNVNENPEEEDLGQHLHQANAENITLFEYHGSYQTNTETYDRFERFDIEGDDETQMNFNTREGAEIPPTLIPSPPRHHDIPEGGNPMSPQRREQQDHGRDAFAEQMEEQNIPDREEQDRTRPAKRARKAATLVMDFEQTILAGPQYQSWLQDASNIVLKGKKRKTRGTITLSMKIAKRMELPPTQLLEEQGHSSYPPQLCELWSKSTQRLQTSTSETRRPDFCEEQSPGLVQEERMPNHHQTDHHQGSEISSQNLGSPAERLRNTIAGKDGSIEGLMNGSRARSENKNRQSADISVTPFYSGDDVRSMPSTPSARGAASINIVINSNRSNRKRPQSSPRRGLEPVAEDRPWEHRSYDYEFSMIPEKGFTADNEVLAETGPTQTQKPGTTHSEEKITDSIKSQLKTHFETPGAAQVESLNKLAVGMRRNAAAQLFYQSCVLATRGMIKVAQTQPYGDILIARGPNINMDPRALPFSVLVVLIAAATLANGYSPPPPTTVYPSVKTVEAAVEGMVYCQSCDKFGSWSLAGAEAIAGAKISIICKNHKQQVSFYKVFHTDSYGHFYGELKGLKMTPHFLDHPLHACRAKLVSSPREDCNLFSNINNALDGASLRYEEKRLKWTNYEAVVYAAGPLAFRPDHCPATPPPTY